jgi:hypothetical protein
MQGNLMMIFMKKGFSLVSLIYIIQKNIFVISFFPYSIPHFPLAFPQTNSKKGRKSADWGWFSTTSTVKLSKLSPDKLFT